MDPDSLETKGYYDFDGQYTSHTHTAHPKIDPVWNNMDRLFGAEQSAWLRNEIPR